MLPSHDKCLGSFGRDGPLMLYQPNMRPTATEKCHMLAGGVPFPFGKCMGSISKLPNGDKNLSFEMLITIEKTITN